MSRSPETVVNIMQLVEQLIGAHQITYQDYYILCTAALSNDRMQEEDRLQISRLLDAVRSGEVQVIKG